MVKIEPNNEGVTEYETNCIVYQLTDMIECLPGKVTRRSIHPESLETWETVKQAQRLKHTPSVLRDHYHDVMLPQFPKWPCNFNMKYNLAITLGIQLDSFIRACKTRKRMSIESDIDDTVDERCLMVWQFFFTFLHENVDIESVKSKWDALIENELEMESFEESAAQLETMPICLEDKLFLMKSLKIKISEGLRDGVRNEAEIEVTEEGLISNFRLVSRSEQKDDDIPEESSLFLADDADAYRQEASLDYDNAFDTSLYTMDLEEYDSNRSMRKTRKRQIKEEMGDSDLEDAEITQEIDDMKPSSAKRLRRHWSPRKDPIPIRQCRIKDPWIAEQKPSTLQVQPRQSRVPFTFEEEKSMWRFVNKKIRSRDGTPLKGSFKSNVAVWRKFAKRNGSERAPESYHHRFSRYLDVFHAPFSKRTRLELYYALEKPVCPILRFEVKRRHELKLDASGIILQCESDKWADHSRTDDEESSDDEEPKDSDAYFDSDDEGEFNPPFSLSETREMWRHILKIVREQRAVAGKTQKLELTPENLVFWREFQARNGLGRGLNTLASHFSLNMSQRVNIAPFDIETKANLYYALHLPVTSDFYNAFRKVATVRLESTTEQKPFIQDYWYKDQSIIRDEWSDLWLKDEEDTARKVRERQ